jgi:hypothetical protein
VNFQFTCLYCAEEFTDFETMKLHQNTHETEQSGENNKKPKLSQTSNETEAESKDETETESKPESEVKKKPILIVFQKVTDFNLDMTANMDYD